MWIESGQKELFIGDSVTDGNADRGRTLGRLGHGYVRCFFDGDVSRKAHSLGKYGNIDESANRGDRRSETAARTAAAKYRVAGK